MSKSESMAVTRKRNTPGVEKGVALGIVHVAYDFGGPSAYTVQRIPPYEDPVLVYSDGTDDRILIPVIDARLHVRTLLPSSFPQSQA